MPSHAPNSPSSPSDNAHDIIGSSAQMNEIRRLVEAAASRTTDVFVVGESGTGKEWIARAIHFRAASKGPFLKVDGAARPGVLDSKLFGPKLPGSTIFLSNVGELPAKVQAHLRLGLDERDRRPHDQRALFSSVRLIASSTRSLENAVRDGFFDAALYRRLAAVSISLPELKERREDIALLVQHFLGVLKADFSHRVEGFSPTAIEVLMHRNWPGNVRELFEYVRTTLVLSSGKVIEPMDLWLPRSIEEAGADTSHLGYRELRKRVLLRFEANYVARVLKTAGGNVSMAARLAKIDRKHLWRLIQRTGVRLDRLDK
ncbi:MAG TPA: sigma 54-interacting transcriptional regulator [Polyangiaceae bacterium]|nr:sigma 54-interacting transcriptional regulator [Polyangiaceae bacterium]